LGHSQGRLQYPTHGRRRLSIRLELRPGAYNNNKVSASITLGSYRGSIPDESRSHHNEGGGCRANINGASSTSRTAEDGVAAQGAIPEHYPGGGVRKYHSAIGI
jgi:hypothetical protein